MSKDKFIEKFTEQITKENWDSLDPELKLINMKYFKKTLKNMEKEHLVPPITKHNCDHCDSKKSRVYVAPKNNKVRKLCDSCAYTFHLMGIVMDRIGEENFINLMKSFNGMFK